MTDKPRLTLRAMVSSPVGYVYTVVIEYVDADGRVDHNMPVINLPAKSFQHAQNVAKAYNAGGDIVA